MEYLETFNEHQKRKFKSFQTEKQADRDKIEEEERKKTYGNWGSSYYGSGYDDEWWNEPRYPSTIPPMGAGPKPPVVVPPPVPIDSGDLSNDTVTILTRGERKKLGIHAMKRNIYEEALLDLYPGTDIKNLPEACVILADSNINGISMNKSYDLLKGTLKNSICIINDFGKRFTIGAYWFRKYKKYPSDMALYVSLREAMGISIPYNLTTGKSYFIIGENENSYEITDDRSHRQDCPKLWFSLPYKIKADGSHLISRTEARGGLYDYE